MIKQAAKGLNSRSDANPYNEDGFLPLITAPMYSVVNETNYQMFLDNKIQVCLPRGHYDELYVNRDLFYAMSLSDFITRFVNDVSELNVKEGSIKVCIDTANGNMPALHDAIRKAKEIHGDNLVIMAGNVGSVEAFVELAKTGVDYIRVGIGGGGGCNTTSNTGIGQTNLKILIQTIKNVLKRSQTVVSTRGFFDGSMLDDNMNLIYMTETEYNNIMSVKVVADGISSWIKYCEKEYGYNDNGYAAINELLFAGADLVMVGRLFAQCVESAGDKLLYDTEYPMNLESNRIHVKNVFKTHDVSVKYSGMSTQQEQRKYRPDIQDLEIMSDPRIEDADGFSYDVKKVGEPYKQLSPSEGSVQWIPVRWTIDEWLNGSDKQDEEPYLMGWINSIKSAMAYTGKTNL